MNGTSPVRAASLLLLVPIAACAPGDDAPNRASDDGRGSDVKYVIQLDTLQPRPTLAVRRPVPRDSIPGAIAEGTRKVWEHLRGIDVESAGPPYTRYHAIGTERVELEVGFPVPRELQGTGDLVARELPGGEVIRTVHHGSYAGLAEAGAALSRWVAEHDRAARGPNWEIYRVNAGSASDPSEYETDVYKPIR